MSSFALAKKNTIAFDVETILEDFAELPDPRSHVNRLHLLGDVIAISFMAVIAGADGPKAVGIWATSSQATFAITSAR